MTTYMQIPGYGELIVGANGWDPAVLDRVRAHPLLQGRIADATTFTTDELRALRDLYPEEWLQDSNAVGDPAHCAQRVRDQFDAGAAGVVLHASSPGELAPLLAAYRSCRPDGLDGRSPVPGVS
ncbi:MAG: hypothetical protein ACKO04_09600 [Actinomycetes bacterium]